MSKLKLSVLFFLVAGFFRIFSDVYSSQQLIPADHWIYDALFVLNNEQKRTSLATTAPLSVNELENYFDLIDFEKLSDSGKLIYQKMSVFFSERKKTFDMGTCFAAFNFNFNPVFYYKSNPDLDWSFATDYTGHVNQGGTFQNFDTTNSREITKRTNNLMNDYGAASSYQFSDAAKPVVELPLWLGWGDLFLIHTTPMAGKNFWAVSKDYNWSNIPLGSSDIEFLWPETAYFSTGKSFNGWGFNFNLNRQGLQIGKTQTGSIIYNSTFQTNFYAQLNLYAPRLKYNLDVVEISKNKYMYLHHIEARPYFNWIRLSCIEGMLIQEPFELRFLNPLMIMHSFGAWDEYKTDDENFYYDGEAHVAAYMGIQVEITPVKNLRIYFLYSQNEIQSEAEQGSAGGKAMPDSLGGQLGFELTVPKGNGWWTGGFEGVYTTPFLYVKQGADWSLYSERYDMQENGKFPICSWIGTPFGPDAIGVQLKAGYKNLEKYKWEVAGLFLAHGSNGFGIFNNVTEEGGQEYYAYYPSVLRVLGLLSVEDSARIARDYKLSGTVSFTTQFSLKGEYRFNDHFSVNGQAIYKMVMNNKNVEGDFDQGAEVILGFRSNLF